MSDATSETPLLELARSVPKDLCAEWESQWWPDGAPCGHSMAPVGRYIHELADEVERLRNALRDIRDSTYRDAVRLRAIADRTLQE